MAEPGFRTVAAEAKRGRGMQGEIAEVVRDLLVAVKPDGTPDFALRQKGVEAYMKNPALLDSIDEEELLPHGMLMVLPVPPELRDPEEGWKGTLPVGTTVRYPEGHSAVVCEARDAYGDVVAGHYCLEELEPEPLLDADERPPAP